MNDDRRREIERDIHASHLAGPIRVLLPTAVVFFTYPLLLRTSGIGVVGVWSILSSILTYAGLLDIGFTGLLTREMASGLRSDAEARRIARWRAAAARVYLIGGVALVCVALSAAAVIAAVRTAPVTSVYSDARLLLSVIAMMIAAVLMLMTKLELTVFRAHHQTYAEQWSTALSLVATYLLGWVGILLGYPIEGLALGAVFAYGAAWLIARRVGTRRFGDFFARMAEHRGSSTLADVRDLVDQGKHLFGLNVAFVLREPLFRLALGAGLGVAAVGIYDIANRVPMLIRELGAAGTPSLLPSIARLTRDKDRETARAMVTNALRYSLVLGGAGLAFFAVNRELLFRLWLGSHPPQGLAAAALVMTVWWGITLLNAPFFWMMQARGLERQLAIAVTLHIGGLLCVVPFLRSAGVPLTGWLVAWTLAGIATQLYLYVVAERRTSLVRPILLAPSVLAFVAISVAAATVGVRFAPQFPAGGVALRASLVFAVLWMAVYAVLLGPLVVRWVTNMRRRQFGVPVTAGSSAPQVAREPA